MKIGIIGGGQLGRMLSEAAHTLGHTVVVIDPTPNSPAGQVADQQIIEDFSSEDAIRKLAEIVDVVTFEIEHINADILAELASEGVVVHPSPETLLIIKDKLLQSEFLIKRNIPVAPFRGIETVDDIKKAAQKFGYPLVLKARAGGYDGRGNATIENESEIGPAFTKLNKAPLYVEAFVPFVKELAVVAARDVEGNIATYTTVETIHKNHICHTVIAPAPIDESTRKKAEALAHNVLEHLKGAGVFGIEMFLNKDGEILVNEIAPRVHNSGHFSLSGCKTSQFEQHIRAITGMPLGDCALKYPAAVMVNILGEREGDAKPEGHKAFTDSPDVTIYLYGKAQTRPERKMGHLNVFADTTDKALKKATKVREQISI